MALLPIPSVPWQVTGNHWLSLPCIHPADASIHAVGVLHRGARAAIEFAGHAGFVEGNGPALLQPVLMIDGVRQELGRHQVAWERALGWIPTFSSPIGTVVLRGTIFAPYGRDADVPGAVYALALENRGAVEITADVMLEGRLGYRQLRVRSPKALGDAGCVTRNTVANVVVLEGSMAPDLAAIAIAADDGAVLDTEHVSEGRFTLEYKLRLPPGGRGQVAFYIAAGPERDGAEATAGVLRRRGWLSLLTDTRDALQALEQTTGSETMDRLINRNLLFAYFGAVGRALDDAHYYLVRSRIPWNGRGATVRDWEALSWIIPAVQLADPALARELLLRTCELHGYAPGRGVHYLDGTLFEPGFSLEGAAAYAIATDRYIRETGDDQIVEEPVLADTLYLSSEDIAARRDRNLPLYTTEVSPSGEPVAHVFTLHGNAATAQALDVLKRTLDEETARRVEDPEAVRAALHRHFAMEQDGKTTLASAVDLAGGTSVHDDPLASAYWLPLYDAVARHDSVYRRTVKAIAAEPRELALQCARLIGPESGAVLQWFRRAPLDGGFAAELVDADGKAIANGGDAALSGLLAWSVWYAVHALGERP